MPACSKCGSSVPEGVKFCSACGAPVDQTPSAPQAPPPAPVLVAPAPTAAAGGISANVAAMLTYLPFCLIGLACAILFGFILDPYKKDRFIRFHAWQSLALHGAFVVFWIGWTMFAFVLTAVARGFAMITFPVGMLIGLAAFILMIFLMIKAYGNQLFKLPLIGDWAENQSKG